MSDEPGDNTIAVLLSGGLDSSILLGHLLRHGRRVQPLYVRCGLAWQAEELRAVGRFLEACGAGPKGTVPSSLGRKPGRSPADGRAEPLALLDLPVGDLYGDHWSITGNGVPDAASADDAVYLPGRNALLLVKAAIWCRLHGIGELALAVLDSNPFSDATPEFFAAFESALARAAGGRVRIVQPFGAMGKREVMALGRGLPLELTFSCIAPRDGRHCGACNKCAERQAAFAAVDGGDPTEYATPTARQG